MNQPLRPGWYPDSHVPGVLRYFDGVRWTAHTAPAGAMPPAPSFGTPPMGPRQFVPPPMPPTKPAAPAGGNWFERHKVASGVLAGVTLLVLIGAVGAVSEEAAPPTASDSTSSTAGDGGSAPDDSTSAVEVEEPVDSDGDGVVDEDDVAPRDADVATEDDIDTDGDRVPDYQDAFPRDAEYSEDADGDGVADPIDDFPRNASFSKDTDGDGTADSVDGFPEDGSRWEITLAMENAKGSAQDYLDFSGFSRQGLIDQLSSEYGDGYEVADATWGVDQLTVDWNRQAVRSARSYLAFTSFSRQGLIDQLSSSYGDQYTVEQATYAADQIGL